MDSLTGGTNGGRTTVLLPLLALACVGTSGCRTAEATRIDSKPSLAVSTGCGESVFSQGHPSNLLDERSAVVRLRECLKQTGVKLRSMMDAPRPCDHFTIGMNVILCPTVDSEGALLPMTIERLDSQLGVVGDEIDRCIKSGATPDAGVAEAATRLERAVHRAEARTRLLEDELQDAVWGHISCPADGKTKTTCSCSPSSTCATFKPGLPEPSCTCKPTER